MSYEVYAHSSVMTLAKVLIALTGLLLQSVLLFTFGEAELSQLLNDFLF
jgi:hypothetical protein